MKEFKFFKQNLFIHQIFGDNLHDVANITELDRVIRFTFDYIQPRNHYHDKSIWINVIMFKLFADKHNTYSDEQIIQKIKKIKMFLCHNKLKQYVNNMVPIGGDVEREMVDHIHARLKWDEE